MPRGLGVRSGPSFGAAVAVDVEPL